MDREEAHPLHLRCEAQAKENSDLWVIIDILQAALRRTEQFMPQDGRRQDVFTPQVVLALFARQTSVPAGMSSLRISRKFYNEEGDVVGTELSRAGLNTPFVIGIGPDSPLVTRIEIC